MGQEFNTLEVSLLFFMGPEFNTMEV